MHTKQSVYLLIMLDTLLLRPSLHFTTPHLITLNSTSLNLSKRHFFSFKLHPNTLHYPLIWLNSIQISYRSISPIYKVILPDTHYLLPVHNFPNMIYPIEIASPWQTVAYSLPRPFPRVRFKKCA